MAFFDNIFGRLGSLVTCIVNKKNDIWEASFISDGKTPINISASTLTETLNNASQAVALLYTDHQEINNAELQYAIYPWKNGGEIILDIKKEGTDFIARDLQGKNISLTASSIEELITKAEKTVQDPQKIMLRWIRPIKELT